MLTMMTWRAIAGHELYALLSAKKVMVQVAVEIRGFFWLFTMLNAC
jgi:hypothetical protein